jgi:hypothetical protein
MKRCAPHLSARFVSRATSLVVLCLVVSCGGAGPSMLPSKGLVVPPPDKSVFLRASFDDDPSDYLGRFIPNALPAHEVDENQGRKTRCSKFISNKVVNAGGSYDEYYNSAKAAGVSIGVPGVASGGLSGSTNATVRVQYELTKKMVSRVEDQEAFDQCCAADPKQCDDFIIGEFYYGTGSVYQVAGSQSEMGASGVAKGVIGDLEAKDAVVWRRSTKFENVYFAFRTQRMRAEALADAGDDGSCDWANNVPTSLDGKYFVGLSIPAASEAQARDLAMRNARTQVVRYMGEEITSSMATRSSALEPYLEDEQLVTAVASGLAAKVKDNKWCAPESTDTPDGRLVTIKVLAFFPEAAEAEAREIVLNQLTQRLKADGKLDAELAGELDKARQGGK